MAAVQINICCRDGKREYRYTKQHIRATFRVAITPHMIHLEQVNEGEVAGIVLEPKSFSAFNDAVQRLRQQATAEKGQQQEEVCLLPVDMANANYIKVCAQYANQRAFLLRGVGVHATGIGKPATLLVPYGVWDVVHAELDNHLQGGSGAWTDRSARLIELSSSDQFLFPPCQYTGSLQQTLFAPRSS